MPSRETTNTRVGGAGSRNTVIAATPQAQKRSTVVLTTDSKPGVDGTASQEQTPTQQTPGKPSVWANGGGANLIKSAVAKSTYNPSMLRVPAASQVPLHTQMSQLNLGSKGLNPNAGYFNPSQGPTPSAVTNNWKMAPSQTTNRSIRQRINTLVCVISGYTRRDFRQGTIIALPFHTPNTNPDVEEDNARLTITCEGPTFSKRRMMVVLWIYEQDMFCLPLYSFEGKGIQGKPPFLRKEYVSVKNVGDKNFQNQGEYTPVDVRMQRKPLHPMTAVHLTGGMKVGCQEDISMAGRMTQESHKHLVRLCRTLNQAAQNESW